MMVHVLYTHVISQMVVHVKKKKSHKLNIEATIL